jgi:lipopolysaccharide export system protein LptC
MAAYDNLHSRLVAWLKILLPLAALALLSTLFLVARTIDPSDAIPYAEVDIDERIREPRITAPTYAGVTSDGAALTVTADEARPETGTPDTGTAQALRAVLNTPDGATTDLRAETGRLDSRARVLRLDGGVQITTSSGYQITTNAMTAALDRTDVQSAGALAATSPMGQITAGAMSLTEDPGAPGAYLLVFKNRVKLIYEPAD